MHGPPRSLLLTDPLTPSEEPQRLARAPTSPEPVSAPNRRAGLPVYPAGPRGGGAETQSHHRGERKLRPVPSPHALLGAGGGAGGDSCGPGLKMLSPWALTLPLLLPWVAGGLENVAR